MHDKVGEVTCDQCDQTARDEWVRSEVLMTSFFQSCTDSAAQQDLSKYAQGVHTDSPRKDRCDACKNAWYIRKE